MTHADGPIELYNLQSDPAEQHNVAAAHPDVIARIADIMKKNMLKMTIFLFPQMH